MDLVTHFWILTLNLPLDGCKYFDRLYEEGEVMIPTTSRKCEYLCTCHVYENYEGQFFCERLCQQYTDYICRPGWESKPVNVSAGPPEYGCFCEENHCVPSLGIDALVARLRLRWTSTQSGLLNSKLPTVYQIISFSNVIIPANSSEWVSLQLLRHYNWCSYWISDIENLRFQLFHKSGGLLPQPNSIKGILLYTPMQLTY